MAPTPNPRLIFASVPKGLPIPGETLVYDESQTIDLDSPTLLSGGMLLKPLAFSLDPYMRNRMLPAGVEGDMPSFTLGDTITGFGIAEVIKSENAAFKEGSHLYGFMPYQEYILLQTTGDHAALAQLGLRPITNEHNIPWSYFVGAAGMTGQTAFFGLKRICEPQPGETIYISAASGAVGQLAVQFAKSLGLKVIASVGSAEKVEYVKSLGADHVFNYKERKYTDALKEYGPINIYFDNVGGEALEAAIANAAMNARFMICGAISCYNDDFEKGYGVKNLWLVNRYRIKIVALVVIDWEAEYGEEFYSVVPGMLASGKLQYKEHTYKGLKEGMQGMHDLFTGKSFGKAVIAM